MTPEAERIMRRRYAQYIAFCTITKATPLPFERWLTEWRRVNHRKV